MASYVTGAPLKRWLVELSAEPLTSNALRTGPLRTLLRDVRDFAPLGADDERRLRYRLVVHGADEVAVYQHLARAWPQAHVRTVALLAPAQWLS